MGLLIFFCIPHQRLRVLENEQLYFKEEELETTKTASLLGLLFKKLKFMKRTIKVKSPEKVL